MGGRLRVVVQHVTILPRMLPKPINLMALFHQFIRPQHNHQIPAPPIIIFFAAVEGLGHSEAWSSCTIFAFNELIGRKQLAPILR